MYASDHQPRLQTNSPREVWMDRRAVRRVDCAGGASHHVRVVDRFVVSGVPQPLGSAPPQRFAVIDEAQTMTIEEQPESRL